MSTRVSTLPRARVSSRDGINDGRGHQGQGGARHGANQGDEEVQPRDDRCEGEGQENQEQPQEILRLQVVAGVNLVLDVGVDDVHWDVELEGVGEGDGQGHHDLHQGGQPVGRKDYRKETIETQSRKFNTRFENSDFSFLDVAIAKLNLIMERN